MKSCKIFNETAQTTNFTDFPLISCGNSNAFDFLYKRERFFLCCKKNSDVSRVCHMKADVLPVPKICGCFLCYNFLNGIYCCPKSGQISRFFLQSGGVKKNKYAFNFEFLTSIFNQGGSDRYVLRLIERQNLKRKIVAVFIFFDAA